uniref:Thioester reductase domain-containing protein n=1 Tax=Candidatus Kentrum sp. FW TaxID=2126338 RepID=A0A450TLX1_9GAMM|nr:MAG: thioester reductase domain-containing protein [Candidatus Kentron sp. FW]
MGVTLDPTDFLRDPTPAAVRRLLADRQFNGAQTDTTALRERMLRDSELDFSVVGLLEPEPISDDPQTILLTGATGFLGANLLDELIRSTTAHVHVLARAEDDRIARERVRQTFDKYRLRWGRPFDERVTCHRGDLSELGLGLSPTTFDRLAGDLEAIIHCGAIVDFLQPYENLRAANVMGMREILALAVHTRIKALHYISTMGVLHGLDDLARDELTEGEISRFGDRLPTGYQQTKWVAERMLSRARERGMPVSVYRPGTIAGHSVTGAANPLDLWVGMMSAIHAVHGIPAMKRLDFLPVDVVAKGIVAIARDPANLNRTYHLCHPRPLPLKTLDRWFGLAGFNAPVISQDGWSIKLERFLDEHPEHMLAPLAPVMTGKDPQRNLFRILLSSPPVSMHHTRAALARYQSRPCDCSILLTHGATNASNMFTLPEHKNLVSFLFDQGYTDVWCADWRTSSSLPYLRRESDWTVDDLILFDAPATVRELRRHIGENRVFVIAHCLSATVFASALAAGLVQVNGLLCNSVSLITILPPVVKSKLMVLPDLIRSFFGGTYLPIDIDEVGILSRPGMLMALGGLTRHKCTNPTCHAISFLWGSEEDAIFLHKNLHPVTHNRIGEFFGPVPYCYWEHLQKIVLAGVMVRFDDDDPRYEALPENYFQAAANITTPMLLFSGADNRFWLHSRKTCYEMLRETHPHLDVSYAEIPGYGHIDLFLGEHAALDVFPLLTDFMERIRNP